MDTKNQFAYFLLSVGIGIVGGILYEIFALLRLLVHGRRCEQPIGIALDMLYGCSFAAVGIWITYLLYFPGFRVYMWIGYLLGGIIYSKTLRRIVAFSEKVCYNELAKLVKKAKKRKKLSKKGISI